VIDDEGTILTSNKITDTDSVLVGFGSGFWARAKVLGRNDTYGIEFIRIVEARSPLPVAPPATQCSLGEMVIAVGHVADGPKGRERLAFSHGLISSTTARVPDYQAPGYLIETDMHSLDTNSFLFNAKGELLGVAGVIFPGKTSIGRNYYYPYNSIPLSVITAMKDGLDLRHGALGAIISESYRTDVADSVGCGAWVRRITDLELERAGISVGDCIVSIDGVMIRGKPDLERVMGGIPIGKNLVLRVITVGGEEMQITATAIDPVRAAR